MNEQIITQLGEKAEQALQILGEKLGQGAEYVWPLLLKQQFIYGIQLIIGFIVGIIILIIGIKIFKYAKTLDDYDTELWYAGGTFILAAGAIISILTIISCIGRLVNPEYYALQEILNLIN